MTYVQVNPDGSGFAKSSFSNGGGSCVELHRDRDAVRDSKNATGPKLHISRLATAELLTHVRR